jgi:hypothetical protein
VVGIFSQCWESSRFAAGYSFQRTLQRDRIQQ